MGSWIEDWANLYQALQHVRSRFPAAATVSLATSDQSMYGFVLTDLEQAGGRRVAGAVLSVAEAISDKGWLSDLNWDQVLDEDVHGYVEVSLATISMYAVVHIREDNETFVDLLIRDEAKARSRAHQLAATGRRVRLLHVEVPASWGGQHLARHVHAMALREGNGDGVRILGDSQPLNLATEGRAFHARLDGAESSMREALVYLRNVFAQLPTFGSLPTRWEVVNIDVATDGEAPVMSLDLSDGTTISLRVSRGR